MVITKKLLRELNACPAGIDLWLTKKEPDPFRCVDRLVEIRKYDYPTWLIAHLLSPRNAAKFAIYSAELVLPKHETEHPGDNRPRKAIQAAKKVLKNPSEENIADLAAVAAIAIKIISYGKLLLRKQLKEESKL